MKKMFKGVCLALVAIIFMFTSIPQNASAEVNVKKVEDEQVLSEMLDNLDQETKDLFNEMDKYLIESEDGQVSVDVIAAKRDNVKPEVLNVMEILNDINELENSEVINKFENEGIITYGFSFPIGNYGNYCGKGNEGGKPIDDLDSACKSHDACFLGFNNKTAKNKKCNFNFVGRLLPIVQYTSVLSYKGAYARAAVHLFKGNM